MEYFDYVDLRRLEWCIENADKVNLGKSYVRGQLIGGDGQVDLLRRFYKKAVLHDGQVPVLYRQIDDDGRRFSHDFSLTNMSRPVRHTVTKDCVDIDIKNAHPIILLWLCQKHGIACNYIESYVHHRDPLLKELMEGRQLSRDGAKKMLLKAINRDDGKFQQTEGDPEWLYDFHQQCKKIADALSKFYPQYLTQADKSKKRKDQSGWNMKGSALNRLLCHHENELLGIIERVVTEHNGVVCNLAYDGCMIKDTFSPEELQDVFKDISSEVQKMYPGMVFQMDVKNMNEGFSVPDSYRTKKDRKLEQHREKERKRVDRQINLEAKQEEEDEAYLEWKQTFELLHCKIMDPPSIVYKNSLGVYEFLSPIDLTHRYSHYGSEYCTFIKRWWFDPAMRVMSRVDYYSPSEVCPPDVFNLWKPYPMEGKTVEMTTETMEMAYLVLHHICIVCGGESIVYEYVLDWIAQFLQFPQHKTTMPTFASGEGAGKNTVGILMEKLMGGLVLVTCKADDIFGKFNSNLARYRLIILNELSAKELNQYDGVLKDAVTESSFDIQEKGKDPYQLRSFHRFVTFTNKEHNPIQTSKDDRRKLIVQCSDEKKGDSAYFTRLYQCLDNEDVLVWLFQFFMQRNVTEFNATRGRNIPKTEYQQELAQGYTDVVADWFDHVIDEYHVKQGMNEMLWTSKDQLNSFRDFCSDHGVKLELDSRKLGVRLSLLVKKKKIQGITSKPSKFEERRHFDFPVIISSFSK